MRFGYVMQSRKVRASVILIALMIIVILIAEVLLQSRRSPRPFEMDNVYGLLD